MSTKKHTIYVINTSESGKSYWNRAGVAFENRDGSFTLKLDILPQTKFQLREEQPLAKEERRRVAAGPRQPGRPALVVCQGRRGMLEFVVRFVQREPPSVEQPSDASE